MMKSSLALRALLLFVPFGSVRAQAEPQVIHRDSVLRADLEALGSQSYSLALEAGAWATLRVNQEGIDVVITTYGPTGTKLDEFDSPNGAFGPEMIHLNSTGAGNYGIEVRSIDKDAVPGKFELRLLSSGTKPRTPAERMDDYLTAYDALDVPGLAIAVMKDDEYVYRKGFGLADLEHAIPITPTTVFHVASVSKQFTAFTILLLAKEGRLSLDDDVRKYIPELPVYVHPITIRDLAQHTSGLRDIDDLLRLSGINADDAVTNAEAVNVITRQAGLNFTPGTAFEYSNSGFMLLAEIVARVSGKPFSVFASERIFTPLGMTSTRVVDVPGEVVVNKAYSYGREGSAYVKRPVNHTIVGSTGLNTTVEDLCRWAGNFTTPLVGDRALMDRMERSGKLANGEPISYALGLDHKDYRGQHLIFHGGGDAGYRSYIVRIPEHQFVVAIASNAEEFIHVEAAEKAIDYFLADDVRVSEAELVKARKPIQRSNYDALVGDYEIFPGVILSFKRSDAALSLNGDPTPIKEIGENTFQLENKYKYLTFHLGANGKAERVDYHIYDFTWRATKVTLKPIDAATISSQEYTGRYLSKELGVAISVSISDSVLVVNGHRNGPIPMHPFQPDEFRTDQGHIGHMAFVRDEKGLITGCVVSGNRAKGILFERMH